MQTFPMTSHPSYKTLTEVLDKFNIQSQTKYLEQNGQVKPDRETKVWDLFLQVFLTATAKV